MRAQLSDFVRKNGIEIDVVFFTADSICTSKELNVNSTKLGYFSYDGWLICLYYKMDSIDSIETGNNMV